MIDLLVPFKSRHLYHPGMNSTASLKSVLPTFVPEMNYDNLSISDGQTASILYLNCIKDLIPEKEQKRIYQDLRTYCKQDTLAEVKLLDVLYERVEI